MRGARRRRGLVLGADDGKSLRPGLGVGNNYWDLLPFGAHDAYATMVLFDALRHFAQLERDIAKHPDWNIPPDGQPFDTDDLARLATEIRADFQKRFWNAETGRFVGWIDVEGRVYDYGFTFVNLQAVHYGLAAPEHWIHDVSAAFARAIPLANGFIEWLVKATLDGIFGLALGLARREMVRRYEGLHR